MLALIVFAALLGGGTPGGLLERGPFTSDLFDAQAHALLEGRLDVDPEVAGIEGFEIDGRTHLYYGLAPAVLRLPVAAMTDRADGRLTALSMVLALAVALWATSRLVWRARQWVVPVEVPPRRWEPAVVGAAVAGVGLASPLLYLSARPIVYHEVELWGTATTLMALHAVLGWWDHPTRARLAAASAWVLLALNTRASVGSGAVVAFALVAALSLWWRHVPWRRAPALAVAILVPVAAYATVNMARFDSPYEVPFEHQVLSRFDAARQATLAATDDSLFGPEFAPTALLTYLRPDGLGVQRLFPWVTFRESSTRIGDPAFDTVDRSASLPVVAPVPLLLAAVGVGSMVRRRGRHPWAALSIGTATGLTSTLTIAFIAHRYLADFTPALVLPAALGLWVVAERLSTARPTRRRAAVVGLATLAGASTVVSAALAVQAQRLFILPSTDDRRGFVALQYTVHDALRGGPPPAVSRAERLPPPGPRGSVVVLKGCEGLFWSDGDTWSALELGEGRGWVLDGPLPAGTTTLVGSSGWEVRADVTAGRVTVRYEGADGTVQAGDAIPLESARCPPVTVDLDVSRGGVRVVIDGHPALARWLLPIGGRVEAGAQWRSRPADTPLCDDLVGRLGG